MSIAPIVHTIQVKAPPARAFDLFAARIGDWWPKGKTVGQAPHVAIVIEPQAGGRWFERDADGRETRWGKVLAWEPPSRLLLGWQLNTQWRYDPELLTEVELTFAPAGDGARWSRWNIAIWNASASMRCAMAERLNGGWPARLAELARYADSHA